MWSTQASIDHLHLLQGTEGYLACNGRKSHKNETRIMMTRQTYIVTTLFCLGQVNYNYGVPVPLVTGNGLLLEFKRSMVQ